jgi:hypothetical protein
MPVAVWLTIFIAIYVVIFLPAMSKSKKENENTSE